MIHKKHTTFVWMILFLCICLTGCMRDEENEQDATEWREQAEELAVTYIEEKYGFTPEVVDSKSNNNDSVVPPSKYIPETVVTLEYEDETFIVVADGSKSTTEKVIDNYQAEEIRNAFQEYLNEYFQVPVYDVYIEAGRCVTISGKDFNMQYNFFHEYYDGTNLEELLTQHALRAYVKIADDVNLDDFTLLTEDSIVYHPKTELLITTHKNETAADNCSLGTYFDKTIYTQAMYICDAMDIRKGEITEYELSIGQFGDIYYSVPGLDVSEYTLAIDEDNVSISAWEHSSYSYEKSGDTAYFVSGTFTKTSQKLYIYYPQEFLPDKPDDVTGYRMGVSYLETQHNNNRSERHEGAEIGEYQVYDIDLKNRDNLSFRLLFETEQ